MANPEHVGPFPKVTPGSGRRERFARRVKARAAKMRDKKAEQQAARAKDKAIRFHCYLRDHKRCRAFRTPLLFESDNLLKLANNHHIVYRSAGGSDEAHNRITLSFKAHDLIHAGYLEVSGDANGVVTFQKYEFAGGTRKFLKRWESRV